MAMEKGKEKQFIQLFQDAEKAAAAAAGEVSGGAEESRCMELLSVLKFFPVTVSALLSNKAEHRLQSLIKKHPSKKIKTLAYDLLRIWETQRLDRKKKDQKNRQNYSKVNLVAAAGAKTQRISVVFKSQDKKNDALLDKIGQQREKSRQRFYEALCRVYKESDREDIKGCDPVGVADSLESAFFKRLRSPANGRSVKEILEKYRSVLFNIEDPKNPDFRRKVLLGEIKAEMIMDLSREEMASNERVDENKNIAAKALMKCVAGTAAKGTTDQFKCGWCGRRETTYYQLQTRSADEPMTTFVTCVLCNNHWKC